MTEGAKPPSELVVAAGKAREERRFTDSIKLLEEALAAGMAPDTVYFHMGNTYVDANQLDQAEKAYSMTLETNPTHYKAMHNLGVVYRRQGRIAESIKCLKAATRTQVSPQQPDAATPLGKRTQTVRLIAYILALLLMAWLFSRGNK